MPPSLDVVPEVSTLPLQRQPFHFRSFPLRLRSLCTFAAMTMTSAASSGEHEVFDPLSDPEERRVLFAAIDSFWYVPNEAMSGDENKET